MDFLFFYLIGTVFYLIGTVWKCGQQIKPHPFHWHQDICIELVKELEMTKWYIVLK